MKRYRGSYNALQDTVLRTGIVGEWIDLGNHKQYRTETGAVLNFWESTKTMTFQGLASASREFGQMLDVVIGE